MTHAMSWGKEKEAEALTSYAAEVGVSVRASALVVNPRRWLGASPDRIVCDFREYYVGLVEVKRPWKEQHGTVADIVATFLRMDSTGKIVLGRSHACYAQVIGQMALCEKPWCDFLVFKLNDHFLERVRFDQTEWDRLREKLNTIYFDFMLPFIAMNYK